MPNWAYTSCTFFSDDVEKINRLEKAFSAEEMLEVKASNPETREVADTWSGLVLMGLGMSYEEVEKLSHIRSFVHYRERECDYSLQVYTEDAWTCCKDFYNSVKSLTGVNFTLVSEGDGECYAYNSEEGCNTENWVVAGNTNNLIAAYPSHFEGPAFKNYTRKNLDKYYNTLSNIGYWEFYHTKADIFKTLDVPETFIDLVNKEIADDYGNVVDIIKVSKW